MCREDVSDHVLKKWKVLWYPCVYERIITVSFV
jgi:hypothetical protein